MLRLGIRFALFVCARLHDRRGSWSREDVGVLPDSESQPSRGLCDWLVLLAFTILRHTLRLFSEPLPLSLSSTCDQPKPLT